MLLRQGGLEGSGDAQHQIGDDGDDHVGHKRQESDIDRVLFAIDDKAVQRNQPICPGDEASAELRKAIETAPDTKARVAFIEALAFKRNKADAPIFEEAKRQAAQESAK